jgi:hypothetical protein
MRNDRSLTVQLAIVVAGVVGLAVLLDRILKTTGRLAQETVAATADTMRTAVESAIQAAVPTEMVAQPKSLEDQMAEVMRWAEETDAEIGGDADDWTDDMTDDVTNRMLDFHDPNLGGGLGASGGAALPAPELIGEEM